jgi:hypothetical protein
MYAQIPSYISKKNIFVLFVVFTILNFTDLLTTIFALNTGLYHEMNVFISFLFSVSPLFMSLYKIVVPLLPFGFLFWYRKRVFVENYTNLTYSEKLKVVIISSVFLAMVLSTIFYAYVVIHNILLLL